MRKVYGILFFREKKLEIKWDDFFSLIINDAIKFNTCAKDYDSKVRLFADSGNLLLHDSIQNLTSEIYLT